MNKQEIIELVKTQILNAESFGIDDNNPHEAVHLSINEAKELLKHIQSLTQEPSAVSAEEVLKNIPIYYSKENFVKGEGNINLYETKDVIKAMQEYANASMREETFKYFFECGRNYQNNAEVTFKVAYNEYLNTLTTK